MHSEQQEPGPAVDRQVDFWNSWNSRHREQAVGEVSERQAAVVLDWLRMLSAGQPDQGLDILEVGCGSGWMCERLAVFGRVTGTDLADEVIDRARVRAPHIRFYAGDFLSLDLPAGSADVVVALEVLSHVPNQEAFLAKVSRLLRPGGYLMLATQNRFVLERMTGVTERAPGQIRHWVNARELKDLLRAAFDLLDLTSALPVGNVGVLRLINSPRLNSILSKFVAQGRIDALKERLHLGHTLMALARRRT